MRKIILFMHMSLDGYVARTDGAMDWVTMSDTVMDQEFMEDLRPRVDAMLLGRVLYQGFQSYWPGVAQDPEAAADMGEFARWICDTPKYVFSKTLESADWQNSELLKGDLTSEVARLKGLPGKDIVLFGGAGMAGALAERGLIDEYRIKLDPVALGSGKPLFKDLQEQAQLTQTYAKAFPSGVVGLYYTKTEPAV